MARVRTLSGGVLLSILATCLVACGGGGGDSAATAPASTPNTNPNPNPNPAPETVTGVATPDSVAVVTATNAN